MKSVPVIFVLICLAVIAGCGGDSSKAAVPSANQSVSSPGKAGNVSVSNPDGTTSESAANTTSSAIE